MDDDRHIYGTRYKTVDCVGCTGDSSFLQAELTDGGPDRLEESSASCMEQKQTV